MGQGTGLKFDLVWANIDMFLFFIFLPVSFAILFFFLSLSFRAVLVWARAAAA